MLLEAPPSSQWPTDMYVRIALISLLLWCAGCTQDPASPVTGASHAVPDPAGLALAGGRASRATPVRRHSFADLPDHGDLVAYPPQRVVRRDGAYTWHRASLSEDHALQAVGGVMAITTPAGERLQFQYERHVEHPSGDWTWIGRAKGGAAADEVVLTFGEKAAFGSISQPGRAPLKLTMGGGVSWLIETDRSRIADIDNPATRPRKPDFLVPPKLKLGSGATAASTTPVPYISSAAALSTAATVVDVLLGYTNGYAAAQGGQSQAVTRLNNMVEITNQAYANSQVEARIRLVHAMQVSYPDNTANDGALEALTGFRAPSTRTTPDAAFAALRSARDQYGADLVSLVRDFNSPENDGCGIAWLIGGGKTGIDYSDEYFGYSVVSDGRDVGSDGKTYFCREETLAHELGHNMGSQHDRVAATVDGSVKYGAYPYSFGYKTAVGSGNFYTVMSYGDTGQTAYRTFSNPRTTFCGGSACGIADSADNARSLGNTVGSIAAFRAVVVPTPAPAARDDVNGDGKSDLLWRNPSNGVFETWVMDGALLNQARGFQLPSGYRIVTSGDFNADRKLDLLLTSAARDLVMWFGDGVSFSGQSLGRTYGMGWEVVGEADFDGNGKSDLLWRNDTSGRVETWSMDGAVLSVAKAFQLPVGYRIATVGDFNGDGRADLFLTSNARDMVMWLGDGNSFTAQSLGRTSGLGWQVVGQSDINGDGKTDLLWRNDATGRFESWLMDGAVLASARGLQLPAGYRLYGTGDFNGDGRMDLFLSNDSRNQVMWFGDGISFSGQSLNRTHAPGWRTGPQFGFPVPQPIFDIDGNGLSDLLWTDDNSGRFETWAMEGSQLKSARGFQLPTGYRIVATGDFNGDDLLDLLITSAARDMVMWFGDGRSFTGQSLGRTYGIGWKVMAQTDLNGDGKSDLIWRDDASGRFETWVMDGSELVRARGFQLPAGYRIASPGDFNGDGLTDLFLTSDLRDMVMWFGDGQGFTGQSLGRTYGAGWKVAGQTDFNGDGKSDLLWRSDATGQFETWLMDGAELVRARAFQLPAGYRMFGSGDFGGDGLSDLVITSDARAPVMWLRDGDSFAASPLNRTYGAGWTIANVQY